MESTYTGTGAELQHRAAAVIPTSPALPPQVEGPCAGQHSLLPAGHANAGRAVPRRPTQRSSNATRRCTRYFPKCGWIDYTPETQLKPAGTAGRRGNCHHGVPAFLHLARAHQIPMRAPAGAEVLQPGFLHQLSMRLETALLRGQAILRGRCCERGAKGGQEQDGQNRFFHELLLQNGLRHGLPSLSNDLRLPTKPQYARTAQSVTFAPACNR
jgi:hypothetical protein